MHAYAISYVYRKARTVLVWLGPAINSSVTAWLTCLEESSTMPAGRSNLLEGQEHTEFFEDLSRARDDEHGIAKVALQTNDYWSRV